MASIKFMSIEIENFKSFGEAQVLDFARLPTGLCFLRGENDAEPALESNGSGKSSIWDALSWVIYGKTPDGLRNPDLAPWGVKSKTSVTLTLEVDDAQTVLKRTAGPNSLRADGKDISQEDVERLVGTNFATFCHTILLGQGQDLFFDLGATDKLLLFSDALDLNRWDARSKAAADKCRVLEEGRADLDRELVAGVSRLDQVKSTLKDLSKKADAWTGETQNRLAVIERDLKEHRAAEESAKQRKSSAEVVEDGALTEKDAIEKSWKPAYDKLFELRDSLAQLEASRSAKQAKLKDLKAGLRDLKKGSDCPTCGQPITKKDVAKHIAELEKRCARVADAIDEIDLETAQRKYCDQEEVIERLRPQFEEKADIAKKARAEVNMWDDKLRSAGLMVSTLVVEQRRLEGTENPYTEQVRKLKKDKARTEARIIATQELLDKKLRQIERTRFWVKGFKDVRLYILEEVLQELQLATNAMLDSVGLEDWQVEFSIEQETQSGTTKRGLAVLIYSPRNKKPVRWESWSGGEGQRLRLVGSMALSEVLLSYAGVSPNLEIFDEPNRGLSPGGIQDLCVFLRDRARSLGRQIWYTDQQSPESALFSAVVTVRKTIDQGSRILLA